MSRRQQKIFAYPYRNMAPRSIAAQKIPANTAGKKLQKGTCTYEFNE